MDASAFGEKWGRMQKRRRPGNCYTHPSPRSYARTPPITVLSAPSPMPDEPAGTSARRTFAPCRQVTSGATWRG